MQGRSLVTAALGAVSKVGFIPRVTQGIVFEPAHISRNDAGDIRGIIMNGERAEHEAGIGGIKHSFGVRGVMGAKGIGVDARKTRIRPHELTLVYEGGYSRICFTNEREDSAFRTALPSNPERGQIYGAWDNNSFTLVGFYDVEGVLNRLMLAFEDKEVLLSLAGKSSDFGFSRFALILERSLSDEDRRAFAKRDEDYLKKMDAARELMAEEHGRHILNRPIHESPKPLLKLVRPEDQSDAA